ncbi:RNA 2'-phosphotransferase [Ferruginibacter sp. SUN106]|uniref:RNA 2'-phosphotransferase n=1 Tax=Ferruginibacter sp. SUN106 TaxID=2978348 RepID=UPI003D35F469
MEKQLKHISKLMSLVLRHKPEAIGLQLNENGWANVAELISKINEQGNNVNFDTINTVVDTNDKKRFAFNEDKTMIRASQGHSIEVELNLKAVTPPDILYHGTAERFVESILKEGLNKQQRQHVHLSLLQETAKAVGARHGKPVILHINAKAMAEAGFVFYLSDNNVWLVNSVPVEYITV